MNPKNQKLNINYPAAYVVNGRNNIISIIKLPNNTVSKTKKLEELSDPNHGAVNRTSGISCPHHININSFKTQVAIGVYGMDLSGDHTGGIMGMNGKIATANAVTSVVTKIIDLPVSKYNAIFSPYGSKIWTSQMQEMDEVLAYDATTNVLKNTINIKIEASEVTFYLDYSIAFIANGGSDTVTAISVSYKMVKGQINVGNDPVGAWTDIEGNMYVDDEADESIIVKKVSDMSVTTTLALGFMPEKAACDNVMSELWVTDYDNGKTHRYTKSGTTYSHSEEFITGDGAHAIPFRVHEMTDYVTNQSANSNYEADVMNHTQTKEISVGTSPMVLL